MIGDLSIVGMEDRMEPHHEGQFYRIAKGLHWFYRGQFLNRRLCPTPWIGGF